MQSRRYQRLVPLFAISVAALIAGPLALHAQDASAWQAGSHSRMRLIAGANKPGQPVLRAGIELDLDPGWKTYWRYPGDSGVPPHFDFAGSNNVKHVDILWPAPTRFSDGAGRSIGYHDHLIWPLHIAAKTQGEPVDLHLKLSYAICKDLCVPAEAQAELVLTPAASGLDALLAAAEARVPKPEKIGADAPLAIKDVRRDRTATPQRVLVDVAAPADAPVDLFVEGPTAEWALPLPDPVGKPSKSAPEASSDLRTFGFVLDGLPPDATADGALLTFTLTAGPKAIVTKTHLD